MILKRPTGHAKATNAADAAPELQVAVHADTEEADVVDETAGEVAGDVVSTDALLGFIREREHAQLRRFGAQHLTLR